MQYVKSLNSKQREYKRYSDEVRYNIEKDASQNEATSTVWNFKKHLPRQAKVLLDDNKQVRKRTAKSSKRETLS